METHKFFMKKAFQLAAKGKGATNPNPMVGAVVVKNSKIISSAYHRRAGTLHAEAIALKEAGKRVEGATLYINLEPCAHIGRTPPCVDAIIKSRLKRVYCAMKDPNPLNNGRGIKILRQHGIEVHEGLMQEEAEKLNEVFIKYITKRMPFVTLKIAESLDGKIATKSGDSKWITSEDARNYARALRREVDAILVGVTTIVKDNPLLTSSKKHSPIKIVIDPTLRISKRAKIFSKESPALCIIAILKETLNNKPNIEKIRRLSKKGVLIIPCNSKNGRVDLKTLLKELAELEISHLLVEGGGDTIAGFIENNLVDRVLFFIAPKIIGGKEAITSVEGEGIRKVRKSISLKDVKIETIGEDILIQGYVYRAH